MAKTTKKPVKTKVTATKKVTAKPTKTKASKKEKAESIDLTGDTEGKKDTAKVLAVLTPNQKLLADTVYKAQPKEHQTDDRYIAIAQAIRTKGHLLHSASMAMDLLK